MSTQKMCDYCARLSRAFWETVDHEFCFGDLACMAMTYPHIEPLPDHDNRTHVNPFL